MKLNPDLRGATKATLPLLREVAQECLSPIVVEQWIDLLQTHLDKIDTCGAVVVHRLTNKPTHCCRPNGHDPPCLDAASILRNQIL